jgi:DNA-binding response OmpR family regulator
VTQPRVLVVDAHSHNCHRLCRGFELEGLAAGTADVAALASDPALARGCDLIVLDFPSCRDHAAAVCAERHRSKDARAPFTLALVPDDHRDEAVDLLDRGLDAYVREPAGLRELVATARALLRRRFAPGPGLEMDVDRRLAQLSGERLTLTEQEFQLLYLFARHPGRVFDRDTLVSTLWGGQTFVALRTVDALVKRLRQRLVHSGAGHAYIQTVRGVGYRLAESSTLPRLVAVLFPLVTLLSQS